MVMVKSASCNLTEQRSKSEAGKKSNNETSNPEEK